MDQGGTGAAAEALVFWGTGLGVEGEEGNRDLLEEEAGDLEGETATVAESSGATFLGTHRLPFHFLFLKQSLALCP